MLKINFLKVKLFYEDLNESKFVNTCLRAQIIEAALRNFIHIQTKSFNL